MLRDTEQLVLAAQRMDAEAFSALAHRFYPVVHAIGVSIVNDWDVAGDVAQETFLLAWSNLGRLKYPRAFPIWLRRIARNVGYTWLRSTEYRAKLAQAVQTADEGACRAMPDPAEAAARRECLERIGDALRTLSPKVREAIVLYYLEGRSVLESAEALGISNDAMKKRLQTGCEHLREYYNRRHATRLEPLLPYSPKPSVERTLAALAVGPVLPALGKSVGTSPISLGLDHLWHGGTWTHFTAAGLARPFARFAVLVLATTTPVVFLATVFTINHSHDPLVFSRNAILGTPSAGDNESRIGLLTIENWATPNPEERVVILQVVPDSSAARAGLRTGDSILKVNGEPIWRGYSANPAIRRPSPQGSVTCFTISRPQMKGPRKEFDVNLVWRAEVRN